MVAKMEKGRRENVTTMRLTGEKKWRIVNNEKSVALEIKDLTTKSTKQTAEITTSE